jgi:hypothetical protein
MDNNEEEEDARRSWITMKRKRMRAQTYLSEEIN